MTKKLQIYYIYIKCNAPDNTDALHKEEFYYKFRPVTILFL